MPRPPADPDWLEALKRPARGVGLGDQGSAQVLPPVCTRCRRPAALRESWLEKRRLRLPDPQAPGGFRHQSAIREHLLCGPCYREVRGGRPTVRHHGLKIMAAATAAAVALAIALPHAMPTLLAAFWRNGAAPAAGQREGRPVFVQGRY